MIINVDDLPKTLDETYEFLSQTNMEGIPDYNLKLRKFKLSKLYSNIKI